MSEFRIGKFQARRLYIGVCHILWEPRNLSVQETRMVMMDLTECLRIAVPVRLQQTRSLFLILAQSGTER